MPPLIEYPAWLIQVNQVLAKLTNNILSAEDFDYPWIEAFLKNQEPAEAAKAALEADGFIIEKLPAPAMLLKGVNNEPRR
ncbi:MAG: hypothetical protein DPW09_33350 [Anaerolineae bacterium]|nr:hypothetical protein [Anaerolineales bacterium]MCQ3978339.1 hypothetical protein [Anaerolineae bacterium]